MNCFIVTVDMVLDSIYKMVIPSLNLGLSLNLNLNRTRFHFYLTLEITSNN